MTIKWYNMHPICPGTNSKEVKEWMTRATLELEKLHRLYRLKSRQHANLLAEVSRERTSKVYIEYLNKSYDC